MNSQHVPTESTPASQIWYSISGIWILLVFLLSLVLSSTIAFQLSDVLVPIRTEGTIPWDFIRRDFIHGLCDAVALLFCLTVGLALLERYRTMASMTIWMSVLWLGGSVWKMMVILYQCDQVLSPRFATSSWLSFDSYFDDPLIRLDRYVGILIGMVLAGILYFLSTGTRSNTTPQPVEKLTHSETIPPQF
jgi:hypothetical protein